MPVYLTGMAESGETTVSVAVDGLGTREVTVKLAPLGIRLSTPNTKILVGDRVALSANACVVADGNCVNARLTEDASPIRLTASLSDPSYGTLQTQPAAISGTSSWSTVLTSTREGSFRLEVTPERGTMLGPSGYDFVASYPTYTLDDFVAAKDLPTFVAFRPSINGVGPVMTVTSADPSRLCLWTADGGCRDSMTTGSGFSVKALADSGTVELRYSSEHYGQGTATVTLVNAEAFLSPGYGTELPLKAGSTASFFLGFRYGDVRFNAPDPGPAVTVTSSDPTVLRVDSISGQTISLRALKVGEAVLTAKVTGYPDPAPLTVTVAPVTLTLITPRSLVVGQNLAASFTVTADIGVNVRAVSSDPAALLVASDNKNAGNGSVTSTGTYATFYAQALAGTGTVTITVSADGYPDAVIPVRLTPSGFAWPMPVLTMGPESTYVPPDPYALDPDTLAPVLLQTLRAGRTAQPTVTSSNPDVGAFDGGYFRARNAGSTVLTLQQPDGFRTPALRSAMTVIVAPWGISSSSLPRFVGRDLQVQGNAIVSTTVTLRSEDPSRLVISADCSSKGVEQAEVRSGFCLQALAGDGVVPVHASGSGIAETVLPVVLTPAGVRFTGAPTQVPMFSLNASVGVNLFAMTPLGPMDARGLRPGVDPLAVPISSNDPSVIATASDQVTFVPGGTVFADVKLRPGNAGNAVLRLSPPSSFHTTRSNEELSVTVVRPAFDNQSVTAPRGLVSGTTLHLSSSGLDLPSTLLVTVVSTDPSRILVAATPGDTPSEKVTLAVNPQWGGSVYFVGLTNGTATLAVSSSLLGSSTITVTVTDPALTLQGSTSLVVGGVGSVSVSVGGQVPAGGSLVVKLRSSEPTVVSVPDSVTLDAGKSSGTVGIRALAAGQATLSLDAPAGYTSNGTLNVNVAVPSLPLLSLSPVVSVGNNLQAALSVYQYTVESLPLTITSSDPSKVLLSLDPTKAGSASLPLTLARTPLSVYVQGLAAAGTATLTWSSPGYAPMTSQVNLYPERFRIRAGELHSREEPAARARGDAGSGGQVLRRTAIHPRRSGAVHGRRHVRLDGGGNTGALDAHVQAG